MSSRPGRMGARTLSWAAMSQLNGLLEFFLPAVPLLFLVVSLLFGHYPGAEAIARLSERIAPRRRKRSAARQARPAMPRSCAVSGGLLIAFRLAQRPPPRPA